MRSRRLAIFDFDGTVADSAAWFFDALNEAARLHGFREVSETERDRLRNFSNRDILAQLQVPIWKLPIIARTLRTLASRDSDQIKPFPWVGGLFAELAQRGVAIAIVSSNSEENIRRILGPDVTSLVASFSAGASLFGKAAKLKTVIRASSSSPERSTSIGDEVRDVDAARTAGLSSLAVTWGYASVSALSAAQPTQLISTPDEILNWFNRLPADASDRHERTGERSRLRTKAISCLAISCLAKDSADHHVHSGSLLQATVTR